MGKKRKGREGREGREGNGDSIKHRKKQRKSLEYADFSRYISGKQEFDLEFISMQEGLDTDSHREAIANAKIY
jgi:hypothetical protein